MSEIRSQMSYGFNPWLLSGGLVAVAMFMAEACGSEPAAAPAPTSAAAQMKAAHDGRGVWNNFPGFSAKIAAIQNDSTIEGQIVVSADGTIDLQLPGSKKPEWLDRALDSVIGHRLSNSEAIQNVEYAEEAATHPLGRLIRSRDAADKSLWRVQGDVLTEVHRITEKTHFVISVADVYRTPEGKHLPEDFTVETWNLADGRLIKSRQVHTEWKRVEGFDLPTHWTAVTNSDKEGRIIERIQFSDYHLLNRATTAAVSK